MNKRRTSKDERKKWATKLREELRKNCHDLGHIFCGDNLKRLLHDANLCEEYEKELRVLGASSFAYHNNSICCGCDWCINYAESQEWEVVRNCIGTVVVYNREGVAK